MDKLFRTAFLLTFISFVEASLAIGPEDFPDRDAIVSSIPCYRGGMLTLSLDGEESQDGGALNEMSVAMPLHLSNMFSDLFSSLESHNSGFSSGDLSVSTEGIAISQYTKHAGVYYGPEKMIAYYRGLAQCRNGVLGIFARIVSIDEAALVKNMFDAYARGMKQHDARYSPQLATMRDYYQSGGVTPLTSERGIQIAESQIFLKYFRHEGNNSHIILPYYETRVSGAPGVLCRDFLMELPQKETVLDPSKLVGRALAKLYTHLGEPSLKISTFITEGGKSYYAQIFMDHNSIGFTVTFPLVRTQRVMDYLRLVGANAGRRITHLETSVCMHHLCHLSRNQLAMNESYFSLVYMLYGCLGVNASYTLNGSDIRRGLSFLNSCNMREYHEAPVHQYKILAVNEPPAEIPLRTSLLIKATAWIYRTYLYSTQGNMR